METIKNTFQNYTSIIKICTWMDYFVIFPNFSGCFHWVKLLKYGLKP